MSDTTMMRVPKRVHQLCKDLAKERGITQGEALETLLSEGGGTVPSAVLVQIAKSSADIADQAYLSGLEVGLKVCQSAAEGELSTKIGAWRYYLKLLRRMRRRA